MGSLLIAAAWGAWSLGCGPPEALRQTHQLAAQWPGAAIERETSVLDIGSPQARAALGAGWHRNERDRERSFAWTRGEAELRFFLLRPRATSLTLRCRGPESGTPLEVSVNETSLPVVGLEEAFQPVVVELPAETLQAGENRLLLKTPVASIPGDRRSLGIACESLRLGGEEETPREPRPVGEDLLLPAGSRVDFFLRVEPKSSLKVLGLEAVGLGSPRLAVEALQDGPAGGPAVDSPKRAQQEWSGTGPRQLELPRWGGLVRLRFEALAQQEESGGALLIKAPRVVSRGPVEPEPVEPEPVEPEPVEPEPVEPKSVEPEAPSPAAANPSRQESLPSPSAVNVVLYLVDTLRADGLGTYGGRPGLTPRLDALAEDGVVFADTTAQSSWTKPSAASILTGLQPRRHRAVRLDSPLDPSVPTLAEHFRAAGWHTGAVVANAFVTEAFGFHRGFDHFVFLSEGSVQEHWDIGAPRSPRLHRSALAWLDEIYDGDPASGQQQPFFLYVHTVDPHAPYTPPPAYQRRFAPGVEVAQGPRPSALGSVEMMSALSQRRMEGSPALARDLKALYEAEIAFQDATFGRFLDALEERDLLDDTVIVFLSDHGEAFGEHEEWTHGLDLHHEVLAVPWLMRLPPSWAVEPVRVHQAVSHVDVTPTLLDLVGLEVPADLDGFSRAPLLGLGSEGSLGEDRERQPVLAHLHYFDRRAESWIDGQWKLIRPLSRASGRRSGGRSQLFARDQSPAEAEDLAPCRPVLAGWLESRLRWLDSERRAPPVESAGPESLDPELRQQLEALGYL
ncbi:MAG: sulfatase [Acidobacteriota bacterium]